VDDDDIDTLHGDIVAEIDDYVKTHPLEYASPTFHADLVAEVTETIFEATIHSDLCDETDQNHQEIADMVQSIAQFYFQHAGIYPVRSFPPEAPLSEMPLRGADADLQRHFQQLKSLPQPAQRTPEWYTFRHNLLTASNIYMALGTTAPVTGVAGVPSVQYIPIDQVAAAMPQPGQPGAVAQGAQQAYYMQQPMYVDQHGQPFYHFRVGKC
jgi:phytoene dehydrogenase-like protein